MAIARPYGHAYAEASVDPQPGERRKRDTESEAIDDSDDEVEPFDPGDDSDLGLDSLEDENVGLDTSLGFDESSDDLEMPDLADEEDDGDDDESWDSEADDASELPDAEMDVEDGDDEYGWTDEDDAGHDDDDFTDDLDDEPEAVGDDGGAEGLEDESEIDDLDLADLPELDKDSEEETGLPGLEGVDELAAYGLLDEAMIEIAPGQVWKMLRPRATRVTRVSWPLASRERLVEAMTDGDVLARSLAVHAQSLFLAAAGLYRLDPHSDTFATLPLSAAEAQQLVVAEHEGALHVLAVAGGQLLLSADGGGSFVAQAAPPVKHAGFPHSASGLRLWWLSRASSAATLRRRARRAARWHCTAMVGARSLGWPKRVHSR
jgi:hypothetical protein